MIVNIKIKKIDHTYAPVSGLIIAKNRGDKIETLPDLRDYTHKVMREIEVKPSKTLEEIYPLVLEPIRNALYPLQGFHVNNESGETGALQPNRRFYITPDDLDELYQHIRFIDVISVDDFCMWIVFHFEQFGHLRYRSYIKKSYNPDSLFYKFITKDVIPAHFELKRMEEQYFVNSLMKK